jgi:carbon-monoxide dehydrogenase medium subunit
MAASEHIVKPRPFAYLAPTTLEEVHDSLQEYGDECKVLAGGQSLGPLLNLRFASPRVLVDLERISALSSGTKADETRLLVPAMTRQRFLETDQTVARLAPLLRQALPYVAHRTIRNRGTIGGSLAHADPAGELPTVAVASDAVIVAESRTGRRRIPAGEFFEGFFTTALASDEIIASVEFPVPPPGSGTGWAEFSPRRGDYAIVGAAARIELNAEGRVTTARIVCAGVTDVPWPADAAAEVLRGRIPNPQRLAEAADTASAAATPPSDTSGSAAYRKSLVRSLTQNALAIAVRNAKEDR